MTNTPSHADLARGSRRIASARGAVLVEYALLLVAVAIPTMIGIGMGGVKMYASYQRERALMLQNTP
jgi:hypothetical protein